MKKITTKIGDKGQTILASGEKVSKASLRVDTYGDIDELISVLGITCRHAKSSKVKDDIHQVQASLSIACAEVAAADRTSVKIDSAKLRDLENKLEELHKIVEIPDDFITPGASLSSAYLDFARSVTRRCERKIVSLFENKEISNETLIVWFNRLSDYLYLLARFEEHPNE